MVDSFFYNNIEYEYLISDCVLDRIRNLTSQVSKSSYYNYMVKWDSDDSDDWITMQFLSMLGRPNDRLIKKYDLLNKKYLMGLLRRLNLYIDEKSISMCHKRPFGNSDVLDDVRHELNNYSAFLKSGDDYSFEDKCLKEFSEFIIDFFTDGFIIDWFCFEKSRIGNFDNTLWKDRGIERCNYNLLYWDISKSEKRDKILDKILDDDV